MSNKTHSRNFVSVDEEEQFLQNMMDENSFVFSEGNDIRNLEHVQNNEDEYSNDDNKQSYHTPHADMDNNDSYIGSTDDERAQISSLYDEDIDISSSNSEADETPNHKANNNKKKRRKNKYKYMYIGKHYEPNHIEQLTTSKWGHYAALDRFISAWSLNYIGDHEILDTPQRYPRWINYKYESYNTSHMLTLSIIIMILASIHESFASNITLLIFTIALVGIMVFIYLTKVILNKKNWKKILIFSMTLGAIVVLVWMVIAYGPLALSKREVIITMFIGIAAVFCLCVVIYLMANSINNVDSYTVCTGFGALYIIVQHTLAANLSTDKFLIYFSFLLFLATFAGYIPFKHYFICVLLLWIEYNLSGFARFYKYVVDSADSDDRQTNLTGYEIIFANIVLWILFIMLGFMVYHKEKENRYEYLDFQAITQENENRNYRMGNKEIRSALNNVNRLPIIEEKDDESISELSDLQRRLSEASNNMERVHLNKAIAALPQPIYRLQSNLGNNIDAIDRQSSIVYSANNTNDYNIGVFPNRARSYQMLYQLANKIIGRKQSNFNQHIAWDKIIHQGVIRASPLSALGTFFGHQSSSSRPQYITRQQQALLHEATKNSPELSGLSYSEKEKAIESNEEEMNKRHDLKQLWSIAHLPAWYMISSNCVLHGYRNNIDSAVTALFSVCCWKHNEQFIIIMDYILFATQVIWIVYMCYYEDTFYNLQSLQTQLIVLISVSIAITRGFVSGTAHLFHCMNEEISRKAWNIDFIWMLLAQCALSIIWIHFIFFCDVNQQILFSFFCAILSFISIVTAYCSIQPLLKDVSICYAMCYNHVFLFGYIVLTVAMKDNDMPWIIVLYWFIGFVLLFTGCLLKYLQFPEIYFLRKHLGNFLGNRQIIKLKELKTRGQNAEIDKTFADINLTRLAYDDRSDSYTIYYFGNSHQLYHLFVHAMLFMNIFAFREYLNWRVDRFC